MPSSASAKAVLSVVPWIDMFLLARSSRRVTSSHLPLSGLCDSLRGGVCAAYDGGVHVFVETGHFITLECPNVRPIRAEIFTRRFDAHQEAPQHNHFVALGDVFLRLKFDDILQFENFAKKLSDSFAT